LHKDDPQSALATLSVPERERAREPVSNSLLVDTRTVGVKAGERSMKPFNHEVEFTGGQLHGLDLAWTHHLVEPATVTSQDLFVDPAGD
jgi:hypothetical protein